MATKHKAHFTDVTILQGPYSDYISPDLDELCADYGVYLKSGDIYKLEINQKPNKKLMKAFSVEGMGYSLIGDLIGVVLRQFICGALKTICISMVELRTPKKLAARLEELGLIPPLFASELNAVAAYINAMAKVRYVTVVEAEGIQWLGAGTKPQPIAVLGNTVYGDSVANVVPIIAGTFAYAPQGDLSAWQGQLRPLLHQNHAMIFALSFGLVPPLAKIMHEPGFSFFVQSAGDTTILSQLISNLSGPSDQLNRWSTRSGRLGILLAGARDRVVTLQEQWRQGGAAVREAMDRHEVRHVECKPGQEGARGMDGSQGAFIFATGAAHEEQESDQVASRTEFENRLVNLKVNEEFGVIAELNGAKDANDFSAKCTAVMRQHFGVASPAWIKRLLKNLDRLEAQIPKRLLDSEVRLAGSEVDINSMTATERQVLRHFAFTAVTGWVAIKLQVLPLDIDEPLHAAIRLFRAWLTEWRCREAARESAPLQSLKAFLRAKSSSLFLPLVNFESLHGGIAGYIKDHDKHGRLYLIEKQYFEDVLCKDHGVEAMVKALREVACLVSDRGGRLLSVRIPGGGQGNENRASFYAIKASVRFDLKSPDDNSFLDADVPTVAGSATSMERSHA